MAPERVTHQLVLDTCNRLYYESGEFPRVTKVIKAIGHGSNSTISKYFHLVKEKWDNPEVSPDLIEAATLLHTMLKERLEAEYARKTADLDKEREELIERTNSAERARAEAETRAEQAEGLAKAAEAGRDKAQCRAAEADSRSRESEINLGHEKKLRQAAEEKARIASERATHAENVAEQRRQENERLQKSLDSLASSFKQQLPGQSI